MSQQSNTERSIGAINSMNEKFSNIAERVQNLGTFESLKAAYYSISQIVADLEELKASKDVALIHSGGEGHPLVNDMDSLLVQTLTLKKHIVIAISQHPSMKEVAAAPHPQSGANAAPPQPPARQSPSKEPAGVAQQSINSGVDAKAALLENARIPLSREEIAKLLLYTSKAFSMEKINAQQKSNIKDLICQQAGYLRIVLQQKDISVLFQALAIIGGDSQ